MDDEHHGENRVSFTVKELLARMDLRLERMEAALESSAKREDVVALDNRVTHLELQAIKRNDPEAAEINRLKSVVASLQGQIVNQDSIETAVKNSSKERNNKLLFNLAFIQTGVAVVAVIVSTVLNNQ